MDGLLEAVGVGGVHDLVVGVEQVALAVGLVDVAEDPAVAVVIGELHARELRIQIGHVVQERRVGPLAAQGRALGVDPLDLVDLGRGELALLLGVHEAAVALVVPPDVAEVAVGHRGAGVVMADHALAGRDRVRERVPHRMARLVLGNGRVHRLAAPEIAERRVLGGVRLRAVVGVDDVAARAAAGAELPGHVVRPEQRERGVEQPRLLEVQPHRVDAVQRAEPARTEPVERLPRRLLQVGQADLDLLFLAPLEDAQDVAGLADLEARQRLEVGQHALLDDLVRRGRRVGHELLGNAVGAVALAEARTLEGHLAVVVERGGPQHGAGLHHVLLDLVHLVGMAAAGPTRLARHAQVARVDELHVVDGLLQQARVG